MKNVAVITVHYEDFGMKVFQLEDDHPAVAFCENWEESGQGDAWIDGGDDLPHLIAMSEEFLEMQNTGNVISLPCMIDHTIFITVY